MSNKKERLEKKMQAQRKKRVQMMTLTTLLVIAFAVIAFIVFSQENDATTKADTKAFTIPSENQQVKGEESAPVTIVKFGDFKCPHCKTVHDSVIPQLEKEFIDTGKAKLQFMNLPVVSQDSQTAAQAGEAIYAQNPEAFWTYYDYLYTNQGDSHEIWATKEYILDVIKKEIPEVDATQVEKALDDGIYVEAVNQDMEVANQVQIESVPALFVNGRMVEDPYDYDALRSIIEEELAKE